MIFVTVGTHEQPFDRLVAYMDKLVAQGNITEEVVIQTGFSTYEPQHCKWEKLFPYDSMVEYVNKARIVITHGGPSSFIMPLQVEKIPIVVPRQKQFDEHVNDHQVDFCKAVAERQGNIITVEDINALQDIIQNYETIVSSMPAGLQSNNAKFNAEFEKLVMELVNERKSDK